MTTARPGQAKLTLRDLMALPATLSVPDAGRTAWGLSRARSYELAARGEFPCAVVQVGQRYYVRAADVMRALGVDPELALAATQVAPTPHE